MSKKTESKSKPDLSYFYKSKQPKTFSLKSEQIIPEDTLSIKQTSSITPKLASKRKVTIKSKSKPKNNTLSFSSLKINPSLNNTDKLETLIEQTEEPSTLTKTVKQELQESPLEVEQELKESPLEVEQELQESPLEVEQELQESPLEKTLEEDNKSLQLENAIKQELEESTIQNTKTQIDDSITDKPLINSLERIFEDESSVNNITPLEEKQRTMTPKSRTKTKPIFKKVTINKKFKEEDIVLPEDLYPSLQDPDFNRKISIKKEFIDTMNKGYNEKDYENIEEISNKLCDFNRDFELESHQKFVRNFMSLETPYNSLLLYHGLGTGKTCSSIQVCEDTRSYLKHMGINKQILIIASPVVQENYKLQLFDERKLKLENGFWNIKSCVGNKFIKEINPMMTKQLKKDKLVAQIKKLISKSYKFLGYREFSNYISKLAKESKLSREKEITDERLKKIIKKEFSNRMIVIDEVHNIRVGNNMKKTSEHFLNLIKYADNMKLLFLTATPMYNDYSEIIWLTNLMNLNDKRYTLKKSDVFNNEGEFKKDENGKEIGKEILKQKLMGYVSYVKGNSPFNFPFSIYPSDSKNPHSLLTLLKNGWRYPGRQINNVFIEEPIQYLDLYITNLKNNKQYESYNYLINELKKVYPALRNKNKGVQYTIIDGPLQLLNMTYPTESMDTSKMYGKKGLLNVMSREKSKKNYTYKQETLEQYGRIFSEEHIGNYSAKISSIIKKIKKSKGIVMIYSQYIEGGCVALALALEELGLMRYGTNSLFKEKPKNPHLFTNNEGKKFRGKYTMITGDVSLSPNNKKELKASTNKNNIYGEFVKVVIISRAGSEGLDFQNIRQIHIMEPWYNLNRTKQTIGRAVRNLSHCLLPFKQRNVEIFLHGTQLDNSNDMESIDLYMYRYAEKKTIKISEVLKVLKEISVDCVINKKQNIQYDKNVSIELSSGKSLSNYNIKFKNNTLICDLNECNFSCDVEKRGELNISNPDLSTYNDNFIIMNVDIILKKIKNLFKTGYVYNKKELISKINYYKSYSVEEIYMALDILLNDNNEFLRDMLGRTGKLINVGDFYMFQPLEINNTNLSLHQREMPLLFKPKKLEFSVPLKIKENISTNMENNIIEKLINEYINSTSLLKNKDFDYGKNKIRETYEIDDNRLKKYSIDYFIDLESLTNKLLILNYINNDEVEDTEIKELIKNYYKKYQLKEDVFILPDEKSKPDVIRYVIITKNEDNIFVINKDRHYNSEIINKFKLTKYVKEDGTISKSSFKKYNIEDNKFIGFFDVFRSNSIVFKYKELKKNNSKLNKGKQCGLGQNKKVVLSLMKYLVKKMNKLTNKNINIDNFKQISSSQKKEMKDISAKKYCFIIYFMLKYLDENDDNNRYFFNLLENFIFKVSEL